MRKSEQEQLLELAATMKNANGMLAGLYQSGNQDVYREVLVNEQTAAISIGTRLDEMMEADKNRLSEEEVTFLSNIVHLLEEYCELLWNASNAENELQFQKSIKELDVQITQITEDLQKIPVRLEVVFFPYKASMWDCMETVWKAAKEDSDCDVYVIPIPYFDLKPDGTAGQVHWEANMMPSYVPIVDYRKYNLEERRPDIVYVHNPYDQYNKVTSVHPDYYCSNLKKYTDMLVYIPYFLLGERLAETHSMLPAYVYADKIVLTGEKMAEDIDPSVPRDKFIMLGSPKAERMVWMEQHKDELSIPREWKNKIQDKKVAFYNVSISGMLKCQEKMLDKMEEVFDIFEKRQDVVLLYRPHPLIEATLTSMCPELLGRYRSLVEKVKRMKNAIYDTNSDAGISVALADVYIGESSSSIVDMFKTVQKPLFFLTEEKYYQPTRDEMLAERTYDACRVEEDVWFVTDRMQMLCKYNMHDKKLEYVAKVPDMPSDNSLKYVSIVQYENKLMLVPYRADALCIYDMERKTFRKDYFREEYVSSCFGRAIVYGHYIFLTPINYPAIVRYDVLTGEYNYYDECITEACGRMTGVDEAAPFVWGVDSYKDELYIASTLLNIVITFHMDTAEYTISQVGKEGNTYRGLVADDTYCWMLLCDSPNVVRWNRKSGEVKEYSTYPEGFVPGNIPFKNIVDMGNALYMVPFHANHICKLDKESGEITFSDFKLPYKEGTFKSEFYAKAGINYDFAKKLSEKEIIACSLYDDSLVVLNTDRDDSDKVPVQLEQRIELEVKKSSLNLCKMWECIGIPLNKYLEYLSRDLLKVDVRKGVSRKKGETKQHVGEDIHTEIKQNMIKK